ncbi:MAG: carbohydrate kinase family protein [Euryarchaeota archaeon]|nr:carbohydrate kinase family protein [Euryarchaeota archaeon]
MRMRRPLELLSVGNIVADFPVGPLPGLPGWGALAAVPNRIEPRIGGNGAIFAVAAARLGMSCTLAGRVGRDLLGDWLMGRLEREGVDTGLVRRGAGGTSSTIALVREGGERAFLHYLGASASLVAGDLRALPRCRWLHFSSMFLLPKLGPGAISRGLLAAKKGGARTSLDVAWDAKGKWDLGRCLEHADYFLANLDEASAITGERNLFDISRHLVGMGAQNTVIKLGAGGSFVSGEGCGGFEAPPFNVEPVDATGAGDVFDAALVWALSRGMELRKAALLANAAGALKVLSVGGTAGAPTAPELLEFIRARRK